jgi:hypothetical protein
MCWLWQWLWSLDDPPTRAAVIGATATVISVAIAFVGVLLTIRSNRVRAREDQLITLRREAYLEACDVTAEAIQFLTTLGDPNVTLASGLPVMRKVGGAIGKLQILADQLTLNVVIAYMNAFLDEYVEVAKLKGAFEMNAAEIATAQQRITLLSGGRAIVPTLTVSSPEISRLSAQILTLSQRNLSLIEQVTTYCVNIVERLSAPATAVTLALRKELKLSLDENWYKNMQAENVKLNIARVKPLLDTMRENVARIREGWRQ